MFIQAFREGEAVADINASSEVSFGLIMSLVDSALENEWAAGVYFGAHEIRIKDGKVYCDNKERPIPDVDSIVSGWIE